ncbi:hypothetical protein [Granulibacter bethesdensis]|uniref:hypothetical protein n=1 Tax=Granulibacter bethesdensis TaxID=364410 RepID=UPI001C12A9E4|nr:hypothetical protein [Granulibacter bethesdensis]
MPVLLLFRAVISPLQEVLFRRFSAWEGRRFYRLAVTGNDLRIGSAIGEAVDIFAFANGQAGGSGMISGFRAGTDHLVLNGFPGEQVDASYATKNVDGAANMHFTLTEHPDHAGRRD